MTEKVTISPGQRKILEQLRPGVRLMLDQQTGRYSLFENGTVTPVDQRPVEVLLRNGVLGKNAVGQCYINPGFDFTSNLSVRKTHLAFNGGQYQPCRYTKHPRARASFVSPEDFAQLPENTKCPVCLAAYNAQANI